MKAKHTTCDKIEKNSKIVLVGTVLSFSSAEELAEYYESLKRRGFEDWEIGRGDVILFPDTQYSSDSFVSIYERHVCVGTPANYVRSYESNWRRRIELAAKCQEIYEARLSQGETPNPGLVLDQAQAL